MTRFGRSAKVRFRADVKRIPLARGQQIDHRQRPFYSDDRAIPDTCETEKEVADRLRRTAQAFRDSWFDPSRGEDA